MTAIPCPHCRHPLDMTDSEVYPNHVTYWGEDEPVERECHGCGARFYLKERVTRLWSVGRTPDEADSWRSAEFDGVPDRMTSPTPSIPKER